MKLITMIKFVHAWEAESVIITVQTKKKEIYV